MIINSSGNGSSSNKIEKVKVLQVNESFKFNPNVEIINSHNWDEFQEVDYIESTGTQFLVLDYFMKPNSKIIADIQFTSIVQQSRILATQYNNSDYSTYEFYINGSNYWATGHKNGEGDWTATTVKADTNRHIFEYYANHYYKIDNIVNNTFTNTATNNSYCPIHIFRQTEYNGNSYAYAKGRIFKYEIYEDDNLISIFKPCYNKKVNELTGLFDIINNNFHSSKGSEQFLKGNII